MFLIFDTETTGLPRDYNAAITDLDNWPRMVQIAWQLHDKTGKLLNNDSINNVVVELKHPRVNLGSKELEQVKRYMGVILEQDEFNAPNMSWEFYLIGNGFDTSGYIEPAPIKPNPPALLTAQANL
jgi:hypothetical protein